MLLSYFSRHHNEPWIPTLRLLHQFPFLLPPQMVDKGAIKFVLSGANIMCPGVCIRVRGALVLCYLLRSDPPERPDDLLREGDGGGNIC